MGHSYLPRYSTVLPLIIMTHLAERGIQYVSLLPQFEFPKNHAARLVLLKVLPTLSRTNNTNFPTIPRPEFPRGGGGVVWDK